MNKEINNNHKVRVPGELYLLTTSIIWGAAFVVQKVAMDILEPFTFTAVRYFLGGLLLIPVIILFQKMNDKKDKKPNSAKRQEYSKKTLFWGGIVCGAVLCLGGNFQQFGLVTSAAGKTGFITTLYIVIVPVFGLLVFRKRVPWLVWVGVVLGVFGLYFLSMKAGDFSMERGDFLVFIGAFFWAAHILAVDFLAPKVDAVKLSCLQFIWAGVFSSIFMFIMETPNIMEILSCWFPILFTSVFVVGVAFTFQTIGQKTTDPAVTSLILSLEAVFGVLAGMLFLSERMTGRELLGCALMFTAVILTQLPDKKEREIKRLAKVEKISLGETTDDQ
jgi:drug/metabolite transporter (DMT)-like permease